MNQLPQVTANPHARRATPAEVISQLAFEGCNHRLFDLPRDVRSAVVSLLMAGERGAVASVKAEMAPLTPSLATIYRFRKRVQLTAELVGGAVSIDPEFKIGGSIDYYRAEPTDSTLVRVGLAAASDLLRTPQHRRIVELVKPYLIGGTVRRLVSSGIDRTSPDHIAWINERQYNQVHTNAYRAFHKAIVQMISEDKRLRKPPPIVSTTDMYWY